MRLLLDTHILIWYVDQDPLLSRTVHAAITDPLNELYLSGETIWEMGIKVGQGKLTLSGPYRPWAEKAILDLDLILLPITIEVADVQSRLPHHHGDPSTGCSSPSRRWRASPWRARTPSSTSTAFHESGTELVFPSASNTSTPNNVKR